MASMRSRDPRARFAAGLWGAVVLVTDWLPPRVRYGYIHRLTRAVLSRDLPSLPRRAMVASEPSADTGTGRLAQTASGVDATRCVLAADGLDIGGIGSVIEALALGLAAHGVEPVVLAPGGGDRAQRLSDAGIRVLAADDEAAARQAIQDAAPDVIQLHSAPPHIERAAIDSGRPLIPVMHNTEIHFTPARWSAFSDLMAASVTGIAVSATVREFHLAHLGGSAPIGVTSIRVVPNGAPAPRAAQPDRRHARDELATVLGVDIADDLVFLCLARYDAQKNAAGLVASFGRAAESSRVPLRLVWAGDPSDWAELRRADALRRAGSAADRIHLLGNSDAAALLAAADAFVLDSFFEGWPMAATEAAAFGLPLLLSDVGGARELVARDAERSVLIPNATGDAGLVSDARVRSARWHSADQSNAAELRAAVDRIAQTVLADRAGGSTSYVGSTSHVLSSDSDVSLSGDATSHGPSTSRGDADPGGVQAMLAGHAAIIHEAAAARHPSLDPTGPDGRSAS